jgi:hypothetical protein
MKLLIIQCSAISYAINLKCNYIIATTLSYIRNYLHFHIFPTGKKYFFFFYFKPNYLFFRRLGINVTP